MVLHAAGTSLFVVLYAIYGREEEKKQIGEGKEQLSLFYDLNTNNCNKMPRLNFRGIKTRLLYACACMRNKKWGDLSCHLAFK